MGGKTDDVRENASMHVCLAVSKLHMSDDWSSDSTEVLLCARVIAGEKAGLNRENAVATYR